MSSAPKLTPSGLSALMCARICHDLLSPVGALGTALEVLNDESNADMHEDALELVKTTAGQASRKLEFLRIAFGAAGSAPGIIATAELKRLVTGMYGGGKVDIVWDEQIGGLEKGRARLLLNLTMLAVMAIPRGGQLTIKLRNDGGQDALLLTSTGSKARLEAAVEKTLMGGAPEDGFDGRTIQPFYAGMLVREMKGKVAASIVDETVTFKAVLPQVQAASAA